MCITEALRLICLYFQILKMPRVGSVPTVRYLTVDRNQGASLWCLDCICPIVLWGSRLRRHLVVKHPVLFGGKLCSPSYYVNSGTFKDYYLSYHRCIDCGTQVIFSEDAMKRHFHSNSHLQISVTPYEDYQYTLTQLDPRHMQICIDHGNGSWEDVLSMIP